MHVDTKTEVGESGRGVLKVSVTQLSGFRFTVEMGVMTNNLCKIRVRRTT